MEDIMIRKVTPDDVNALQNIGRATFMETFADRNSTEDMKQYLERSFSIEKLGREISDEQASIYFAELNNNNNKIIGYLKVNTGTSQTEMQDDTAVEIERIYVLKDFQGKKAGQLLYQQAMDIAKERNAEYVWLGVWEKNEKAINFYRRNGFMEFDKHVFTLGKDAQTDIMMKKILVNG